jgi:NADH dehydrogenase [ubiquinone] 1 alpha subcomplex assembly factor 7
LVRAPAGRRAKSREIVNALGDRIVNLIKTQGPLSVAQFMTIALHDPTDGYYATHHPFGIDGDFITAPDISQMFGELAGLWCAQVWMTQHKPARTRLVELGPGRGTLMADAVRACKLVPDFIGSVEIVLVEASPVLRAKQRERLEGCGMRVSWSERLEDGGRPLLLIANEFFDALPVRQYVATERGWCERLVVADAQGGLAFALAPFPSSIGADANAIPGSVYESSPAAEALAEQIGRAIARHGGGALIVDYGYAERSSGETLQAVGRHQFKDVLESPGSIDISAHVDFAGLADAARHGGAQTFGPIGQGQFLESLGIGARAENLCQLNRAEASLIMQAVDRLVGPDQMGSLFKVLAILPPNTPPPPGF